MREPPVAALDPPPQIEQEQKPFRRLALCQMIFVGFAFLIVWQLVRWQIIERESILDPGREAPEYREEIPSQRGLILDKGHSLLALNNYDYTILAAPNMIREDETAEVARKLASLLGWSHEEMVERLSGDELYAPIERHVPREVGKGVIALDLPGIFAYPLATRVYPERSLAAHTLGFVAGDKDSTKGYYGLEGFYDKVLKGEAGLREGRWDPWTRPVSFADRRSRAWRMPQEGRTLVLTIDKTLQYLIEQELRDAIERYGAEGGCIIVMDPKTGGLLATTSYPDYDPNLFSEVDEEVLMDPAIGRHYEPGSTFKIFTMAAALDSGLVRPDDMYNDVGYIEVGGRILKNWDEKAYGLVDMTNILVYSLNTGAAHVSTVLGASQFYHYVNRFGFGRQTGVDLEGEVSGVVRQQGDPEWHESDLGTNAFGQGVAATPLQMVAAVGAVANRGFLMRPYVVEQLIQGERVVSAKQVTVRQVISEETARVVTEMMVQVVEDGAKLAQVDGYRIAGKTGTAQTPIVGGYDPHHTIASFIGFAPADDPRFVVLVKLDKPSTSTWGAATAAPTFARVAQILFTHLAIPPDQAKVAAN